MEITQNTSKRRALLICGAPIALLLLFACCASVYRFLPGVSRPHWLTEKRQAMRRDSLQRIHAFVIAAGKQPGKEIETDLAFLKRELSDIPEGCR